MIYSPSSSTRALYYKWNITDSEIVVHWCFHQNYVALGLPGHKSTARHVGWIVHTGNLITLDIEKIFYGKWNFVNIFGSYRCLCDLMSYVCNKLKIFYLSHNLESKINKTWIIKLPVCSTMIKCSLNLACRHKHFQSSGWSQLDSWQRDTETLDTVFLDFSGRWGKPTFHQ